MFTLAATAVVRESLGYLIQRARRGSLIVTSSQVQQKT
jgi:hypothetical protein